MSTELWLQEPRRVIDEPGAAFGLSLGREDQAAAIASLKRGELSATNLYFDPVAGVAMGMPSFDLADTTADLWDAVGANWAAGGAQPRPYHRSDGNYTAAMAFRANGSWSLTSKQPWDWGVPLLLRFITYHRPHEATTDGLCLTFGGVWKLHLLTSGQARLEQQDAAQQYQPVAAFDWMSGAWAPTEHWLWIYQIGPKLVIRQPAEPERADLGVAYWDVTAAADPAHGVPLGAEPIVHALRRGTVTIEGHGYITLACGRQGFVAGSTRLEQVQCQSVGVTGEGSTQAIAVQVAGLHGDGITQPTIQALDEHDVPWPTGCPDQGRRQQLRWSAQWTTTADSTYYLSGLSVAVPQTHRWSGQSGTNVLALPGVANKHISLSREGDLTREHFDVRLFTSGASLAAYVQPNMALRYVVDGLTRFRGYSEHAEWNALCDPGYPVGTLQLIGSGLWSRFRRAVWPGGAAFDGRRLTDCLRDLAAAAGLTPDECSIVDDAFTLPATPRGEAPALDYRAGTKIDHILDDLREKFCGQWLALYFRLSDGKFVVEYAAVGAGSAVAAFYETTALAEAAAATGRVILGDSYQEQLDATDMANVVTVAGASPGGEPLLARCVDTGSIRDTTAANLVAEVWPLTVCDPGLGTQAAVNWACRSLFGRHRYPRVFAQWRSIRVDLFPGDLVQLVGPSYGGLYRLRGMALEQAADGDAAAPAGRASYSGERVA